MAVKTDFVALYEQLGLRPDCSAAELRNAYRRRVAELHPDRQRGGPIDPLAGARLQELTAAYLAASDFQRRFGRLPGARLPRPPSATPLPVHEAASPHPPADSGGGVGRTWRIASGAVGLGLVLWLVALGPDGEQIPLPATNDAAPASAPAATVGAPPPAAVSLPQELELGMEAAAVRALEGPPLMATPERWDYGPSWIDFDHGRVSDWYSSPLRPLKGAGARSPRSG